MRNTRDNGDIGEIEIVKSLSRVAKHKLRRIDENKLNKLLDVLPNAELQALVYKPLSEEILERQKNRKTLDAKKLPSRLARMIVELDLLSEPNHEKRLSIFTGYCRYLNYSINTASKYLSIMKRHGVFGQDVQHLYIDRMSFVDSGNVHTRTFSFESFKKIMVYMHQNFTPYVAPIMLACYSGLRTFEVLQFSNITLHQLALKQTTVSIFRKKTFYRIDETHGDEWRPIYTTYLNTFVSELIKLYKDLYDAYERNGIIVKLFPITPKTLCTRLRTIYFMVNGYKLPLGAGIHSFRNMLAMLMAQKTQNVWVIQTFLQHKDATTTRRYIHADFTHISKEFDRLTKEEFSDVIKDLDITSNTDTTTKSI